MRPGPDALVHAQDKAVMRQRLDTIRRPGAARTRWSPPRTDVADFAKRIGGFPIILKTTRGGYDGKGVWVATGADDPAVAQAFGAGVPILAEEKVDFVRELSAWWRVAARPGRRLPDRRVRAGRTGSASR